MPITSPVFRFVLHWPLAHSAALPRDRRFIAALVPLEMPQERYVECQGGGLYVVRWIYVDTRAAILSPVVTPKKLESDLETSWAIKSVSRLVFRGDLLDASGDQLRSYRFLDRLHVIFHFKWSFREDSLRFMALGFPSYVTFHIVRIALELNAYFEVS